MNRTILIGIAIAAALTIAAGSFWAGSYYQRTRFFAGRQLGMMGAPGQGQHFGQPGLRRPGDGIQNGAMPRGERIMKGRLDRVDDDKLTLTTQFGSIKMTIAKGAKVSSAKKAALTDLKVGKQLIIQGAVGADGQVTAKSVIEE